MGPPVAGCMHGLDGACPLLLLHVYGSKKSTLMNNSLNTAWSRELREAVELPLVNPELFARVGIKPPTGVLLYGPPGTGKTLLAKAIASNIDANFLKVVASGVVDKYIGESARVIREMFG